MNRIDQKFYQLKKRKGKALIIYMMAGDPSLKKNEALIYAFEKEGVDLIELGVPFSDPLADGQVIQEASQRALKQNTNLAKILQLVARARKKSQIPIVLMSYLNPILSHGIESFARSAKKSGVDGLIIPDLPPDEGKVISAIMGRHGIDLVYLIAPTSTQKRIRYIAGASRGFIYYVSLTGITGMQRSLPLKLDQQIKNVKNETHLPVCVGFGVSSPEQARSVSRCADGVIIGSAIVKALVTLPKMSSDQFSKQFIRPFAKALGKTH